MGGYRKGSGRSKSGYYKSIYCGSTYELCWVIYSFDHNIKFSRFDGCLERGGIKYFPDFLLDDGKTIIETKGYESSQSVDKKTKIAESFGYIVMVLRKDDLTYAFDYVKQVYKTNKFYTLYDEYKPRYSYYCDHCQTEFTKDIKLKTEIKFCSRVCAGKYRKQHRSTSQKSPGYGNYKRILSKEQALDIFQNNNCSLQELAGKYHVTKNTVWFIKQKRTYKWIHD